MKTTTLNKALTACVATCLSLTAPATLSAQEIDLSPRSLTIDNVTVDGTEYNSVTIRSQSPLFVDFDDATRAGDCQRGAARMSSAHFGRSGR